MEFWNTLTDPHAFPFGVIGVVYGVVGMATIFFTSRDRSVAAMTVETPSPAAEQQRPTA
jgi:hypothetical protein